MKRLVLFSLLFSPALAAQEQDASARLRDSYRRLLSRFRTELQSPDARPWDVSARAEALGSDPAALLEFVRKLRLDAYPGLQRGPSGVLVAGGGNPADKAALLAELLRSRGHQARLVRGTLTAEKAGEITRAALAAAKAGALPKPEGPFGTGKAEPGRLQAALHDIGLSAEEVGRRLQASELDLTDRWREVLEIADREDRYLRDQFRPADAEKVRPLHDEIAEAFKTHYWVQAKPAGKDEWSDLDPSFPDAKGAGAAGEEVDPAAVADVFHLKLVLDRTNAGKPESVDLLDWEVRVHETLVRPLRFAILPDQGMEDILGGQKPMTEAQLRDKLKSFRRFQASLMIGAETVGSNGFDLDGRVFTISKNGSFIGSSAAGKLAGALDLLEDKPKESKTALVALKIRFSTTREGRELWIRERAILEEGRKDTWCPILSWAMLLQNLPFSSAFASGLGMSQAVRNQGFFERAMTVAEGGAKKASPAELGSPGYVYPFNLLSFARSRMDFLQARAARPYWESADLFLSGSQIRIGAEGLCLCEGFDLVENGTLALEAGERFAIGRDATRALGVFDTVLEQVLLRQANAAEPTAGTLAGFEAARLLGEEVTLLAASDPAALEGAGLRKADARGVTDHAREGERTLVARGRGSAWWSYEPATGRTVGRITGGRGGAEVSWGDVTPGYVIHLKNLQNWVGVLACLGTAIKKIITGEFGGLDAILLPTCIVAGYFGGWGTGPGAQAAGSVLAIILSLIGMVH